MRPALFVPLVILIAAPAALFAQTCSQPNLRPYIHKVKAAQSQLRAYNIGDGEGEQAREPLQKRIQVMKDAFATLADAAMKCAPETLNARALENSFVRPLDANKPVVAEEYDPKKPEKVDDIYGDSIDVKVTRPAESSQILLVDFRFEIQCGFDSLLLGYEWHSNGWQQVLRWQSGNYDVISGAFGDFFAYQVVPRKDSGDWLIAVAHGHPWCSSNMSGFDLDVIQPARNDNSQKVLLHKQETYWRDDPTRMRSIPDGFELRVSGYSRDVNIIRRTGIYRYSIDRDRIERVQPIAMNGRDFVDEWLNSPWEESQNWNFPSELANLEATYKKIATLNDPNAKEQPHFTYGPVRTCSDSPSHFQVELDYGWWWEEKKDLRPDARTFFQIQEGKNSFTMLSASDKPDPHCTGHDIMPSIY